MVYNIHDFIKNTYFDEVKELSPYIRQAELFRHFTEDIPLQIRENDQFAGWYGYEEGFVPEAGTNREFAHHPVLSEEQRKLHELMSQKMRNDIYFTSAHTCIDYGTVIEKGLEHYMLKVQNALAEHPEDACLQAMAISLKAAYAYAGRYAALVKRFQEKTEDPQVKERMEKIYQALCRVPEKGARNFLEAVQAVWLMHSLVPMAEMSWASISIGRIDQYLYPFYKKHLQDGGTAEEAKEILKHLFLLLDSYGDGACAMNIGGMDIDGHDMMNELSRVIIEVEKEMALRAPILAVRVTPETPEEILDDLIDPKLFQIGQPTFYGELPCRRAVMERGISEEEAAGFSANSCMGLILAGREFADMWGIKFNSHLPLELALNHGSALNTDLDLTLQTADEEVTDFEQLLEKYQSYLAELLPLCTGLSNVLAQETEANRPDPFLSALTDGCIQNRGDRSFRATYNTITVETMGLVNTCDALNAIRELVFEQKKYTLAEFVAAAKADYKGYEKLRNDILKCPKYGMNDPEVNAIGRRLMEMIAEILNAERKENRIFVPSLHTIDVNVGYGAGLYATLDGRLAGEPVNKNANPSQLLQKREHTSVILSAAALGQQKFSGGQPIDLYFDKAWFESKASRDRIKALIRTYFEMGGLQFQVNSIDIELLEKAHREPEKYPFVIVRKGGYSVRFTELWEKTREEFIEAAKRQEGTYE